MIDPGQHFADSLRRGATRRGRAINHDDRQIEHARRVDLGARTFAARIFGDDEVDPLVTHQGEIARQGEGSTIHEQMMARQRRRRVRRIDEAENIMMLRLISEGRDMHAAEREHDPARLPGKRLNRAGDIGHMGPTVALSRLPCWAGQHKVSDTYPPRRLRCVGAHRGGEGMGRVNQMRHRLFLQISGQPCHAAEAADANRYRLRTRVSGASDVAQHGAIAPCRERLCERTRFSGAAQDEDVAHDE